MKGKTLLNQAKDDYPIDQGIRWANVCTKNIIGEERCLIRVTDDNPKQIVWSLHKEDINDKCGIWFELMQILEIVSEIV